MQFCTFDTGQSCTYDIRQVSHKLWHRWTIQDGLVYLIQDSLQYTDDVGQPCTDDAGLS